MTTSEIINSFGVIINTAMFGATAFMVYYTKKSLEVQNQPQIMVSLVPLEEERLTIGIRVENVGTGPAYDIHFTGHEALGLDGSFMENGISYLAPKTSRVFWWNTYGFLANGVLSNPVSVTAHYYSSKKSKFLLTECILDISDYRGYNSHLLDKAIRTFTKK